MPTAIEEVKKKRWIALYAFLIMDFIQILFVSIINVSESNPFVVSIDLTRTDPLTSTALFVGIVIIQIAMIYYLGLQMQRSDELTMLYPKFVPPKVWSCKYSRDQIVDWTHEVAKASNMNVKKIFLVRSPLPNAFTFSLPFFGSIVAVHSNILEILQPDEVKAILAHEIGHISNRDSIVQLFARLPTFFIDVVYLYIYLRLGLGVLNAIFVYSDGIMAGLRIMILLGFIGLSRFLAFIAHYLAQKASREAELLSDYHAAKIVGAEATINGLIRLGQRSEAISVLIDEIRWLESLNPERSGAVPKAELIRMIEQYPLDGIDEANARERAPAVFLVTRLRHMREVYGVNLTDDQIKEAVDPALAFLATKRPESEESEDKKKETPPQTIDWRTVDYNGDRRLSRDELKDLLDLLRSNPQKLMFDSEVGMNLMSLSHPDFRRRVITVADAFGL